MFIDLLFYFPGHKDRNRQRFEKFAFKETNVLRLTTISILVAFISQYHFSALFCLHKLKILYLQKLKVIFVCTLQTCL